MVLWAILAVLTAVVITVVCLPLVRPKKQEHAAAQSDAEIYKAQLAEIEEERERGVLSASEAEAARIEVSRRLLRSTNNEAKAGRPGLFSKENDRALAATVIAIPALALSGYLVLGSPMLPQQPHAASAQQSTGARGVAEMISQVEERLRSHPDDGAGWDVIAPVYLRQQDYHDAVFAFQQALRLNGENAARLEGLGEAMVLRDNGQVSETARMAFTRALARDPESLKSRFWLAISDEQNGKLEQAAEAYKQILNASPEGAPWRAMVGTRLAIVQQRLDPSGARAPSLSPEAMRSAESMTQEERAQMIENMVANLSDRLANSGGTAQEWAQLITALVVLGRVEQARAIADEALVAFADEPQLLPVIQEAMIRSGLSQ